MESQESPRVLVLGEGKAEEGPGWPRPGWPGAPLPDEWLGALHVLVRRILREFCGLTGTTLVGPPALRTARRPGNPGLLYDLEGLPRPGAARAQRPLLAACVGRNAVDLVVVVKDAARPGEAEDTRAKLRRAVRGCPSGTKIVVGAATPCIEGWLLPVPESDRLAEAEVKLRWKNTYPTLGDDWATFMAGRAHDVDLQEVCMASPSGFVPLVKDLCAWAKTWQRP